MCGIVASASPGNIVGDLVVGLERLEYRGYDSAGISITAGPGLTTIKDTGRVERLVGQLPPDLHGNLGIAHTRWATQGRVTRANAHPHECGGVSLVHNGIVENFDALRAGLGDRSFRSETDSELLAILIRDGLDRGLSAAEATLAVFVRIRGQNAIAVLVVDPERPEILAVSSHGLVVGTNRDPDRFLIASDQYSLETLASETATVAPGVLVTLTPEGIGARGELAFRPIRKAEDDAGEPAPGESHLRHEILSQPAMARRLIAGMGSETGPEPRDGGALNRILAETTEINAIACGSSFYASLLGKYWFEHLLGIPFRSSIASEFNYRPELLREGAALLSISQSGETADTLVAAKRTNREGYAHFLALSNDPHSSLPRISDYTILMEAGREISVAATRTFTAQLIQLLGAALSARGGGELWSDFRRIPEAIEAVIGLDGQIREVAERIAGASSMLFIARGILLPVAYEGALKMKEVSYIHAEGYAGGELKHGSLALVDPEMPVVALASTGSITEKIRANLREIRAREGTVFLFCDEPLLDDPAVGTVLLPRVHYLLAPFVAAVAVQLLAYHVATLRGIEVDRPRNLAKSVTVE